MVGATVVIKGSGLRMQQTLIIKSVYTTYFLWFIAKETACSAEKTRIQSLVWEDPLEKGMATYSNILAERIPWAEEPG